MPILLVTLFILVIKGLTLDNTLNALEYLFKPEWVLITPFVFI